MVSKKTEYISLLVLIQCIELLVSCQSFQSDVTKELPRVISPDGKAIIYQSTFPEKDQFRIYLATWIQSQKGAGGGGIFDILLPTADTLKVVWTSDTTATIEYPSQATILRQNSSDYFYGRHTYLTYHAIFKQKKKSLAEGKQNAHLIKTVKRVFEEYTKNQESTDSQDNKDSLIFALNQVDSTLSNDELSVLVNVWMYYDPTDFPTRELTETVFLNNRERSKVAILERINKRENWETKESAPYSELSDLLRQLEIEKH
jgi:hypothetical protein